MTVFAGLSLTDFVESLKTYDDNMKTDVFKDAVTLFEKYSSTQVRNIAV